jgi:16S rRNA (uracil1498-N3)-methyltransferase
MATITPISHLIPEIQAAKHIALLIGPEGGFSPTEHQTAIELELPFVSLGEGVLKAETAAITATSFVRFLTI